VVESTFIAIVVPPTAVPAGHPTIEASAVPTENFCYSPNVNDVYFITSPSFVFPSADPTADPTEDPTADLSDYPSADPTANPSTDTSDDPSADPATDCSADRFQTERGVGVHTCLYTHVFMYGVYMFILTCLYVNMLTCIRLHRFTCLCSVHMFTYTHLFIYSCV
jgi:hypothetical protein